MFNKIKLLLSVLLFASIMFSCQSSKIGQTVGDIVKDTDVSVGLDGDKINVSICITPTNCFEIQLASDEDNQYVDISDFVDEYESKYSVLECEEITRINQIAEEAIQEAIEQAITPDTTYLLDYEPIELREFVRNMPASPNPIAKSYHHKIVNGEPIKFGIFQFNESEHYPKEQQKKDVRESLEMLFKYFDSEVVYTENIEEAAFKVFYVHEGDSVPYSNDKFPPPIQYEDGGFGIVMGFAYPPYERLPDEYKGNIVLNATRTLASGQKEKNVIAHEGGHALGLLHRILPEGEILKPELMAPTTGGMSNEPTQEEYTAINSLYGVVADLGGNDCPQCPPCDPVIITEKDTVYIDNGLNPLEEAYKKLNYLKALKEKTNESRKEALDAYIKAYQADRFVQLEINAANREIKELQE